ncbi:hypothetical protein OHB04_22700 [Streptomyces sp. NBC_01775]|uniref:hypothetical protein n=1 Tax=Streptomyces sp. NBC_01775 TaxID=2975939 RepID=UPI002DD8FD32|nr:hypothetical protein [Streptomyces sp. NBC_01775]WSB78304.1 hypothetical protein OHB04_22700 [Streptomyces sp. NBC_01775]
MTARRPGEWPVTPLDIREPEPQHERATAEPARVAIVLGSVRAHLETEPTDNCVRAAARRWAAAITAEAEAVITARQQAPG